MRATAADVPRIVDLGARFHAYSCHRGIPFDAEAFRGVAERLVEGGAVFLSDDGMCGGLVSPLYFNPAFSVAVELFWYAPNGGKGLREEFEAWAEEQGVSAIQFSAMADDHLPAVTRLYRRAGYAPIETLFLKRL
jgi:hypothetical protein